MKYFFGGLVCLSLFMASCNKEDANDPAPETHQVKLTEFSQDGAQIAVWLDDSLHQGYNSIYLKTVNESGQISAQSIDLNATMDMGGMLHGTPVDQLSLVNETGEYRGGVVFTMAGVWDLKLTIDGQVHQFSVDVSEVGQQLVKTQQASDGKTYVVALNGPKEWVTGLNDFQLYISRSEDMMSFSPVSDLTIDFQPDMPAMGHGSPNNKAPDSQGSGHYKGVVNFTMTGQWLLHFTLQEGSQPIIEDMQFIVNL